MMRAGFVEMQLVPRGTDRAPSRSFFTWKVDLRTGFARIAGAHGCGRGCLFLLGCLLFAPVRNGLGISPGPAAV